VCGVDSANFITSRTLLCFIRLKWSVYCKICRKVKGIERVAAFIVLACYEIVLVSVYLVGTDNKTVVSSDVKTLVTVWL